MDRRHFQPQHEERDGNGEDRIAEGDKAVEPQRRGRGRRLPVLYHDGQLNGYNACGKRHPLLEHDS